MSSITQGGVPMTGLAPAVILWGLTIVGVIWAVRGRR